MSDLLKKAHLAKQIRNKVERYAKATGHRDDLQGLCLVASFAMAKLFKANGYVADVACTVVLHDCEWTVGHCWVVSEGTVFDVTATQFGWPFRVLLYKSPAEYRDLIYDEVFEEYHVPSAKANNPLFRGDIKMSKMVQDVLGQ